MEISITIWKAMVSAGKYMPFVFVMMALILLEHFLIRMKSKGKTILPVLVFVLTLIFLFVQAGHISFQQPESLMTKIEYSSRNGIKSGLTVLHTEDERILAIGQLITEEDADSRFIDLVAKDGKIVSASEPIDIIDKIESDLSCFKNSYSGESVLLGELLELEKEYQEQQPNQIDFVTFLFRFLYGFILVIILFGMYGISCIKRGGCNV